MDGRHVTGVIFNSINEAEYPDGVRFTILNVELAAYPRSVEFGAMHFIARTPLGTYFRMNVNAQGGR